MESTISSKLEPSLSNVSTNTSNIVNQIPFLNLNYWFQTPEPAGFGKLSPVAILSTLLIIFVLLIVTIKLFKTKLEPPQQKFLSKVIAWLFAFGPLGWFLVLARNQGIVFVSDRFWWVVWALLLLLVIVYLYRYYRQKLPQLQAQYKAYQVKKKYFPVKKKKR